jgi:hypothetical protein
VLSQIDGAGIGAGSGSGSGSGAFGDSVVGNLTIGGGTLSAVGSVSGVGIGTGLGQTGDSVVDALRIQSGNISFFCRPKTRVVEFVKRRLDERANNGIDSGCD